MVCIFLEFDYKSCLFIFHVLCCNESDIRRHLYRRRFSKFFLAMVICVDGIEPFSHLEITYTPSEMTEILQNFASRGDLFRCL
ncbi:hypothetical protein VNO80_04054 [Phaseolus coccineus]|uniref:Uncharacterized protein n=1 Tax=Phaseolus coccineus TaxID=3886 RepID=A0AAN9P027_PHACN